MNERCVPPRLVSVRRRPRRPLVSTSLHAGGGGDQLGGAAVGAPAAHAAAPDGGGAPAPGAAAARAAAAAASQGQHAQETARIKHTLQIQGP